MCIYIYIHIHSAYINTLSCITVGICSDESLFLGETLSPSRLAPILNILSSNCRTRPPITPDGDDDVHINNTKRLQNQFSTQKGRTI
jgi:hypothetical protein